MMTPIEEYIEQEKGKKNPFKTGTQCHRLLEFLRMCPRTNTEIVSVLNILKYTGRISDLRQKNIDIKAEHLEDGLWKYSII